MMFKPVLIAILLVFSLGAGAQERAAAYAVDEEFNLWNKKLNDTACVFADIAYIRDYPGLKGIILDSLSAGTRVIIKSEAYNNTLIKDFHAPWYKIEYTVGSKKRSGFIWLGLLSLGTNQDKEGRLWIYGFNKYPNRSNDEAHLALCEIKVLDPSLRIIGKTSTLITKGGQLYTSAKILNNMGLTGIQAIYRIGFFSESCGVSTDHYYIGWTGNSFVDLPGKSSVSDAGVLYHEEKLLFPSEHQLSVNLIIKEIVDGEVVDPNQQQLTYKETKARKKFSWNGKMVSEIIEMK